MKIDSGAAQQAYASTARLGAADRAGAAAEASKAATAPAGTKVQGSDSVQISTQGRLRAQALDAVQGAPETRSKLVMELRSQIKMGAFSIDDESLAHKIAQHIDVRA